MQQRDPLDERAIATDIKERDALCVQTHTPTLTHAESQQVTWTDYARKNSRPLRKPNQHGMSRESLQRL